MKTRIEREEGEKDHFYVWLSDLEYFTASNQRIFFTLTGKELDNLVAQGNALLQDAEVTK